MQIGSCVRLVLPAALVLACSATSSPPVAPGGAWNPPATAATAELPTIPAKNAQRGNVAIAQEIRSACGIDDADAYFAFDSARISGQARQVLQKVAECFQSGPLAGRSMHLVGHADPRGGEEYNMVLGERRADSVASTLEQLGLSTRQMSTTSRGEMDAKGTDPAGWAKDRRVDVMLAAGRG